MILNTYNVLNDVKCQTFDANISAAVYRGLGKSNKPSATKSCKSTVSCQTTADKCQEGNLFQHANEFVIVETDCGAGRVLLTNCNRHCSKWGGVAY